MTQSPPPPPRDEKEYRARLKAAAERALAEARARKQKAAEAAPCDARRGAPRNAKARELGGPKGPEPTRYGDWERKGIAVDF